MEKLEVQKQTINQFCIYDIVFYANPDRILFAAVSMDEALKSAHKLLGNFLSGNRLHLTKEVMRNGEKTTESILNDILSKHDDVYLLRINNNKPKSLVKEAETKTNGIRDFEEIEEISNPYCYVVIDNRDSRHLLAIQKNPAFGDTSTVAKILEKSINDLLLMENIPIEIQLLLRTRTSQIWEFCDKQCRENGDRITRLSFAFPNQSRIDEKHRIPREYNGFLSKLAQLSEYTEAVSTLIQMDYEEANPKALEKQANDFAQIFRYCKNTAYKLEIYFRDYGKYKCDDRIKAMFKMDEELITAFRTDFKSVPFDHEFGLVSWCNEVYQKSEIYKDREKTPKRRKRGYK